MAIAWQQPLPSVYRQLTDPELQFRIGAARASLGSRLVILGHHYQRDEVIAFADKQGDSFELSRFAASLEGVEFVVFCGVHFMAETADMLSGDDVAVILPDIGAGCSMADMADLDQTLDAWDQLAETCPGQRVVPVTYMNSTADIKAFVGENGGAVCTSSNAKNVLEWALAGEARDGIFRKILFFPDQHLGRNTASSMGFDPETDMVVWDPHRPRGGNDADALRRARFVLWKGHCSVHALFRPEHVDQARQKHPDVKVMVHPECRKEVVDKADLAGSTAFIVQQVNQAPAGTVWAIGTETNLVERLRRQHPEQTIFVLSDCQCLCTTMTRIDLPHLCYVLETLAEGDVVNRVTVDPQTRRHALVALDRMLAIPGTGSPVSKAGTDGPMQISTAPGIVD